MEPHPVGPPPDPRSGTDPPSPRDPLVLLADPWAGAPAWRSVRPLLSEAFLLLDVTLRDARGDSFEDQLVRSMVDSDLHPAHVLATPFAAAAALRLAIERPELFRSLVLHEPVVPFPPAGPVARPTGREEPTEARRDGPSSGPVGEPGGGLNGLGKEPDADWPKSIRTFLAGPAGQVPVALGEFLAPVLIVEGGRSPAWVRALGASLAGRLPHARLLELPGATGQLPDTEPARLAGLLMTFCLERNVAPA